MAEHVPNADTNRGIQNTHARFTDHTQGRLTSEQLLRNDPRVRDKRESSDDTEGTPRSSVSKNVQILQGVSRMQDVLKKFSRESGIDYDVKDAELLIQNAPIRPDFPFFMLAIAILKDILDVPFDLSVIGVVVTTVFSFLLALVLFFWFWGKLSGGWWKKKMVGWLWRRYAFAMVIEFIPFFKIIPATTILIFMAHYRETQIVTFFNATLEKLHEKKIPGL